MSVRAFLCPVSLGLTVTLHAQIAEVRAFAAPDGGSYDQFGHALALSGDRMLIGAWADDDQGSASGSAYVFERDAAGWRQVAKLLASDGEELYYFGTAVALEGDRALIGASRDDEPVDFSGSVYVFERLPAGTWLETGKLETGRPGEGFGSSIGLQGDRAIISAPFAPDLPGHVFVYERDALGSWNQVALLTASDAQGRDYFGSSVALSGDRVLIGAYGHDEFRGAAYVFERDAGGAWVERARLEAGDGAALDRFGDAVALGGDRALVGAREADAVASNSGAVYVFERAPNGRWLERATLTAGDGERNDRFGWAVALDGGRALIGAADDNDGLPLGPGHDAGSAYVFELGNDGTWREVAHFRARSAALYDHHGDAVVLRGDLALVGAVLDDGASPESGAAFLFDLEPLSADVGELSLAQGGVQTLELDAGHLHAGLDYLVLGSLSGTEPGIPLPHSLLLPLNPDGYFLQTLRTPGKPPLGDAVGVLDANGLGGATFTLPPGLPLALAGRTVHHAFVAFMPGERAVRFASNARSLLLVP